MFGTRNNAARKLTSDQVEEVRLAYEKGETQGSLARRYGMSVGQIGRIVRGESWGRSAAGRAVQRPPTAFEDHEALQQRLLDMQAKLVSTPPPSPLDGGDTPDETGGAGSSALADKARELGVEPRK